MNSINISSNERSISSSRTTSNPAHSINAQAALDSKLSALQKAQRIAAKTEHLPDGRIRYYTEEIPSRTFGPTRGGSYVTEHNQRTGQVRSWYACYDHSGNVNRVHPNTLDGQELYSQHYPPTKSELESFMKNLEDQSNVYKNTIW